MFSGLVGEKALFRSFVFKMFSGLGTLFVGRHDVAMQFIVREAGYVWHQDFLLHGPGRRNEGSDRKFHGRLSAGFHVFTVAYLLAAVK
jgi:hypothetical protein